MPLIPDKGGNTNPRPSYFGNRPTYIVSDGKLMESRIRSDLLGIATSLDTAPTDVVLTWDTPITADRCVIWAAMPRALNAYSTLLSFDLEVSLDGETWVNQASVDVSGSAVTHPIATMETYCYGETYWCPRWFFNLKFDAPVTFTMARILVHRISHAGEADEYGAACNYTVDVPKVDLQEVAFFSDAAASTRYLRG